MRLRGPGDFFGEKQHGLPDLKIANMAEDMEVLKEAQSAARHVLSCDPKLEQPEHRGLKGQVKRLFSVFGGQGFHRFDKKDESFMVRFVLFMFYLSHLFIIGICLQITALL